MRTKITIQANGPPIAIDSVAELDSIISEASATSRELNIPNVILLESETGNCLSLVVGAQPDTVVGFTPDSDVSAYFVSLGRADADRPVLVADVTQANRTELMRRWVISWDLGLAAAREFIASGDLPKKIQWIRL